MASMKIFMWYELYYTEEMKNASSALLSCISTQNLFNNTKMTERSLIRW